MPLKPRPAANGGMNPGGIGGSIGGGDSGAQS